MKNVLKTFSSASKFVRLCVAICYKTKYCDMRNRDTIGRTSKKAMQQPQHAHVNSQHPQQSRGRVQIKQNNLDYLLPNQKLRSAPQSFTFRHTSHPTVATTANERQWQSQSSLSQTQFIMFSYIPHNG